VGHGQLLLTPFHNMALICPDTTFADADAHLEVFAPPPTT
jgi:glutamate-1-semialdehyde 2,1-aminomutase